MAVKFKLDRSYVKDVRDLIADCDTSLADCAELFDDVMLDVFIPSTEKTFEAEGRPVAWKPLDEAYAKRKAVKVGHTRILVYSDALINSVADVTGDEYSVREIGPRRILFGTTRPWAAVHQKNRPFLLIQDEDYSKILDMTTEWLVKTGRYAEGGGA